jgi:prophage regulatory protein
MNQHQKLIRIKSVINLTGLSKSYIYQLRDKKLFPQSIQLVAGGSSVAWVEKEVLDWIESRIQARTQSRNEAA